MNSFKKFNLLPTLEVSLKEKNLVTPTDIQDQAIPLLLQNQSLVGVAETGSGKTLSFVLPILHILKSFENAGDSVTKESSPRALIIVPTRELGEQVTKVFKPFTHTTRLRVRSVLGGSKIESAKDNVKGKFEVLVATPGRLLKFMNQSLLSLNDVSILIFDEADQMLDPGFLSSAKRILSECKADAQKALFSATVSTTVEKIIQTLFSDVQVIKSHGSHRLVPTLTIKNINILNGKRYPVLDELLKEKSIGSTLIFTNSRDQCDKLFSEVTKNGHKSVIYRGEMDKVQRRKNLTLFKEGKVDVLISTDLASRGLDLENIGLVINYHLPKEMNNYIHRVGRTARAGRKGKVINFVTERDEPLMKQMHKIQSKPRISPSFN